MVKREKSPEINEDIILFVVWIPYPLNPNWVYEQDVQDCAKWVAEVIGNEYYLISIHQKPSSRGMVLLEISKEFTDHGRLLGQHQWFHFLKDPTKDEEGHKSCVYYSIYRTCREARKDGWNPIPTSTKWFKDWSPGTGRFVSPYPDPKHCPPPPEDRTSKQICRHIPLSATAKQATPTTTKSKSVVSPVVVVGSSAWIAQQKQDVQTLDMAPLANQDKPTNTPTPVEHKVSSTPKSPDKPQRSKSKAIPLQKFMSQSQAPQKSTLAQAPAWPVSRSLSSPSPVHPIAKPPTKPQNAWSQPLKIAPSKAPTTTNPESNETWVSHDSWADLVATTTTDEDDLDDFLGHFSSPHSTTLVPPPTNNNSGPSGSSNKDWGSQVWSDAEDKEAKTQETVSPQLLQCPTHGPACSKKICEDYNKLERDRKREEAKKNGQWRGRGRGRGRGRFFKGEVD